MKIFKKIIIAMLLCVQGASLVAMKPVEQKKIGSADWTMFQRALNSASKIEASSEFYRTQSLDELHHLIDEVTNILGNEKVLAAFSKEFQKPVSEIERLFQNSIGHARVALESKEQAQFPPLQPAQKSYLQAATAMRKQPAAVEKKSSELGQSGNHLLHIMLDIPERNTKGQLIDWGKPIQYLTPRMNGAQFIPNEYHHITLARYKSAQPLPEDFIPKIHKALSHAQEILKISYAQGIGIALDDNAILLGSPKKDVVAFNVAHSVELEKVKEIISKFISFEDVTGFEFRTFSGERPFHVALGRVKPKSAATYFESTIKQVYAPAGARASQGQQFSANRFSLSYNTKDKPQKIIETYDF